MKIIHFVENTDRMLFAIGLKRTLKTMVTKSKLHQALEKPL